MAVRQDVTVDFTQSPRIATVASPSTEIKVQDAYDTLSKIQGEIFNSPYPILVKAGGKDDLGGGFKVGVTLKLQNAKLAFEARPGPSYVQCDVTEGNLVAVDGAGAAISPIQPTAFTQVVVRQSTAPALVTTAAGGNTFPKKMTAVNNFTFTMRDSAGALKAGLTVSGQIKKDAGGFAALTGTITEVGGGLYQLNTVTATELTADIVTLKFSATGAVDTLITMVLAA